MQRLGRGAQSPPQPSPRLSSSELTGFWAAWTSVSLCGQLQPILRLERGKSMRTAIVITACIATVAGCAPMARPGPAARVALPPFDDAPISFVVAAPRFTPGEVTIVKVCVAPDRSILSADVMESSGDRRFDDLAVTWARQVRVRSAPSDGSPLRACGEVRVEIRTPTEPRVISRPDSSLS
jgi:hypothetical protein